MKRFGSLFAATCAVVFVLGLVEATPASAATTITVQHCSTSANSCQDQTVDNDGEVCILVTKNAGHKANWCIYDHGWSQIIKAFVDGRVQTCVGVGACVGVNHFHWGNSQITVWALSGGNWYGIESGSSDVPPAGNTGPTETLYTTGDYNMAGIRDCNGGTTAGVYTHSEADIRVYWTDGTSTSLIIKNSDNYCHNN